MLRVVFVLRGFSVLFGLRLFFYVSREVHRGGSSWGISIRVWIVRAWGFNLINYVIWIVDCSNLDGESREVPLCNIYLCFVDKSFWSFRSYSSARPIVRAGMEGINGI